MKTLLFLAGLLALAAGVLWACEGLGYVNLPLPYMPPMFGNKLWAWYGAGVALIGLLIILYARRGRGKS